MQQHALLASDMDGTLIPLEQGPLEKQAILNFADLMRAHPWITLAYITGRHLELGLAGVNAHRLPLPHIFVCDVGTAIFHHHEGSWQRDEEYRGRLADAWQGLHGGEVGRILEAVPGLVAQEEEKQAELKQSYYVALDIAHEQITEAINARLHHKGISANIIYSVDSIRKVGLIDVLPPGAAKDHALHYLQRHLDLAPERIVYAGDSGNDMLAFVSGYQAIIVANTGERVKEEARRRARAGNFAEKLFFASQKYTAGVIEGCRYFRLFTRP